MMGNFRCRTGGSRNPEHFVSGPKLSGGTIWFGGRAAAGPTLERMTLRSGIPIDELDPGIRPQDDLFRHVNGRWLARTEIPADRARDSAFRILADEAENAVHEIVAEAVSAPEGSEERKFGDLYASFMDADRAELLGSHPSANRSRRPGPSAPFRSCWRRSGGCSHWESVACTGSLLTLTRATRSVTWCFSSRAVSRCPTRAITGRSGSLTSATRSPGMCSGCSSWPGCRTPSEQPGGCSRWRRRWLGTAGTRSRAASAENLQPVRPGPVCCQGRICRLAGRPGPACWRFRRDRAPSAELQCRAGLAAHRRARSGVAGLAVLAGDPQRGRVSV